MDHLGGMDDFGGRTRLECPRWYAIYTRSRHEQAVNDRLSERAIETFLPMMERWSRRRDRRKRIRVPLFPGYLFAKALLDNHTWVEILKTDGVVHLLSMNRIPQPVPEKQVLDLKALTGMDQVIDLHPYLKVGDRVRVVNGPLAGVEGFLVREKPSQNRLVVSIDLLMQSVSVELDIWDVEPISIARVASDGSKYPRKIHHMRGNRWD